MNRLKNIIKGLINNIFYTIFLTVFLTSLAMQWILSFRLFPKSIRLKVRSLTYSFLNTFHSTFPINNKRSITRLDLVEISVRTLMFKKVRTAVTAGGMAIGIGVIVLLVSIGYGLQNFVVSSVASFEEMKQVDVASQVGRNVNLDSSTISDIKQMKGVEDALPVMAIIAQVNYSGSASTVAAYGITPEYLTKSAVRPVTGEIFSNKESVLGVDDAQSDVPTLDWVALPTESTDQSETKIVELHSDIQKEIVVNTDMLMLLGVSEGDSIGKKIKVSYRIPADLLNEDGQKLETEEVEYTIVGVVNEGNTPIFYFPIQNLNTLEIRRFSSVRVVLADESELAAVREKIGVMGFATTSVVDTINQIETLFDNIRVFLTLLGMIALFVASLGVFNTLTVSLLERTKEVGLLKSMGMNSTEVKELFLTEGLLLALTGCFAGIFIGFVSGKLLSLVLTIMILPNEFGWFDISYIPFSLVLLVIALSVIVGLITGIYPAKRAKRISALDAMRYE